MNSSMESLAKSLADKDETITARFLDAPNWEDRYHRLIQFGKNHPGLNDDEKLEDLKVKGCQSQVWIKADLTPDGRIHFRGDSDALIVRGLVAVLVELFDNESPQDILTYQPQFFSRLSLTQHLSPSRANGLAAMLKQIKFYALAYQMKLGKV
jgi:cysteine desulfuration protein SufE